MSRDRESELNRFIRESEARREQFRRELERSNEENQRKLDQALAESKADLERVAKPLPKVPTVRPLPPLGRISPPPRINLQIPRVEPIKPTPEAEEMMARWEKRRLDEQDLSPEELDAKRAEEFATGAQLLVQAYDRLDITATGAIYNALTDIVFYDLNRTLDHPQDPTIVRRAEVSHASFQALLGRRTQRGR